ncbi:hypothetical protein A2572_03080 [Candidatus Collierbacteria bacterium RIFOXYD1_FULL_40_9]|uniref:HAD family hydrolase n=1 Tax=Candidatus Collierbacteria bacterium RIFOXYD1_FULL_40_9 TaxID=1817731 RepID=A0A1F5FWT6_9BACT|nr:MAG: hypothetical protein A2572_03080 [Candidatus Collierbacteria bacterium RIFOXYD1_FULL_40_9]
MNKKSVALFDFDKTIYKDFSIFTSTKYLVEHGFLEGGVEVEMMEEYGKYKLGIRDYKQTAEEMIKIQAKFMTGLDFSTMRDKMIDFFAENEDRYFSYFERILPNLRETHDVYLVTASSQLVAEAIEKRFNLDGYLSTIYEVKNERLTGEIEKSLVGEKGKEIKEILAKYTGRNMAFGDSDSDIEMLLSVEVPVCVEPTDNLKELAQEKSWLVVTEENAYEEIMKVLG